MHIWFLMYLFISKVRPGLSQFSFSVLSQRKRKQYSISSFGNWKSLRHQFLPWTELTSRKCWFILSGFSRTTHPLLLFYYFCCCCFPSRNNSLIYISISLRLSVSPHCLVCLSFLHTDVTKQSKAEAFLLRLDIWRSHRSIASCGSLTVPRWVVAH